MYGKLLIRQEVMRAYNDIFDCVYNEEIGRLFPRLCDMLSEMFGIEAYLSSFFEYRGGVCTAVNFIHSPNIDPKYIKMYEDTYWKIDCIKWYLDSNTATVFRELDVISPDLFEKSAIYNEWYVPMGYYYSAIFCISVNGRNIAGIEFLRKKEDGDFPNAMIEFFQMLNAHLCSRFKREFPNGLGREFFNRTDGHLKSKFSLTDREAEVVHLLSTGICRQEICNELCISMNTFKKHLQNIYRKMGVTNQSQFYREIRKSQKD